MNNTSMTSVWFGPVERATFGWLHLPTDGQARGAVILCQSLGTEQLVAHLTMRHLAAQLTARGIAVFRFDYPGTGDSAGDLEQPDLVNRWLTSIYDAVEFVRSCGIESIGLMGIKMGGVLASNAATACGPLSGLALWDPYPTGRSFLRRQHSLYLVSSHAGYLVFDAEAEADAAEETANAIDDADRHGVPTAGFLYPSQVADDLGALQLLDHDGEKPPLLLIVESDVKQRKNVTRLMNNEAVSVVETSDSEDLFGVNDLETQVPTASLLAVADWFASVLPIESGAVAIPKLRTEGIVDEIAGSPIVEKVVELGHAHLVGLTTEHNGHEGALIVLANTATTYHVGQSRLWVDVARSLAANNLTALRIDNFDIGDSPKALGNPAPLYYSGQGVPDLVSAIDEVTRDSPDRKVAIAGLCSGSWLAMEVAIERRVSSVFLINPVIWKRRLRPTGPHKKGQMPFWHRAISRLDDFKATAPLADFLMKMMAALHIVRGPTTVLKQLVENGTKVHILLGVDERAAFERTLTQSDRKWLDNAPGVDVMTVDAHDHALVTTFERRRAHQLLVDGLVADLK